MPYIRTQTSTSISAEKEKMLKEKLGNAIAVFPGKTEKWLMLSFEENCRLWFAGTNDRPAAMVEVMLLGKAENSYYDKMTEVLCQLFADELGIPADRIYVKYEECSHWGWNGSNF